MAPQGGQVGVEPHALERQQHQQRPCYASLQRSAPSWPPPKAPARYQGAAVLAHGRPVGLPLRDLSTTASARCGLQARLPGDHPKPRCGRSRRRQDQHRYPGVVSSKRRNRWPRSSRRIRKRIGAASDRLAPGLALARPDRPLLSKAAPWRLRLPPAPTLAMTSIEASHRAMAARPMADAPPPARRREPMAEPPSSSPWRSMTAP